MRAPLCAGNNGYRALLPCLLPCPLIEDMIYYVSFGSMGAWKLPEGPRSPLLSPSVQVGTRTVHFREFLTRLVGCMEDGRMCQSKYNRQPILDL
jgi:hypothetical protein